MQDIISRLKVSPVIAAVKDERTLSDALKSKAEVLFLLKSDIQTAADSVRRAQACGKSILVHVDLMDGLGKDDAAVSYVHHCIRPDGIISVRAGAVKAAAALKLFTVFRVFLIDSKGVDSAFTNIERCGCNAVEIMPGIMPELTKRFSSRFPHVIVGGLIENKTQVDEGLNAGALAASTSAAALWDWHTPKTQ